MIRNLCIAGALVLSLAALAFLYLFIQNDYWFVGLLIDQVELVASKLYSRKAEFLFFVGATYISLLLLEKKRFIYAGVVFSVGVVWVVFHQPVSSFIGALGVDSFSEAKDFDLDEAKFWIATVLDTIKPDFRAEILVLHSLYLFVAVSSFYSLRRWLHSRGVTRENFYHLEIGLPGFLVLVAILLTFSDAVSLYFRNSESYLVVSKNFENKSPDVMRAGGKIDVLVYVGESTSIMNMGLYGYPRGTTPRLARIFNEDENFILFNNVFSTHTHTAPSLLEAFSFALNAKEDFLPIERRRRISVVDVLRKAGVDVRLISNQGMVGTWNQASSIVFKAAQKTFSADSRRLGNNDGNISRPWDDVFFDEQLSKLSLPAEGGSSVNFLHSYAGHGAYLANIPEEWRVPVDDYFFAEPSIRVAEDGNALSKTVEDYDSAIKYIDYSVSKSIAYVRGLSTAAVLIYFSDHGDSAFTGRAHDSSRFMHEMVRVPFVIYFNDSARKQSPELYRKYRDLAKAGRLSSLAQLPSTILDIVGVRLKDEGNSGVDLKPVVGEETLLPPIVVREIGDGISFVNLSAGALMPPDLGGFNFIDSTDPDTRNYLAIKGGKILPGDFCDTAALSFELERRRQIIGGCALKAELGANRVVQP